MESNQRSHQIIESLLAKPSKKPDFKNFKGSDVLKRAQQFMPMFIQTTDRLLSDPELLKQHQMDIKVIDKGNKLLEGEDENIEEDNQDPQTINMDIGVGVYDVQNENFDEKNFMPKSTRPIVQFHDLIENENDDSSSQESDDSNLYYEFNSDSENMDNASSTTKATKQEEIKRPMIIDITPNNTNAQQKKSQKKNNKKRQRRF